MTTAPEPTACSWSRTLVALSLWGAADAACGWTYPEHRDTAVLAVQMLDAERRAALERLWQDARAGDETRLCSQAVDREQGLKPKCIDWAALSAIGGDHSCSSQEMLETVRTSDWILEIAAIAAQLKVDLAGIPIIAPQETPLKDSGLIANAQRRFASAENRAKRSNALRTADTHLQQADPQYATRADANLAHFMLPRPDSNLDPLAYAVLAAKPGSNLNAAGVYVWYHVSALQKASRLADPQLSVEQRRALTRSMLFDEAFALHFMEDLHAAGHIAGSWGDVSQRKGTHDFYNQNGIEVITWQGREKTIVLMGDAHMRPEDAEVAAKAVRTSLEQVLDVATERARGYRVPYVPDAPEQPDAFDICERVTFPDRGIGLGTGARGPYGPALEEALLDTPVPGLGPGLGALPRERSELGAFLGLTAAIDARLIEGGLVPSQRDVGVIGALDIGVRAGFELRGALRDSGDGLVFGQLGFRAETPSTNDAAGTPLEMLSGSLSAAIPARTGLSLRLRMPFYLVPGDLLLLSPLYFANRTAYTRMAITAADGGLIPWQQGLVTPIGRFQFMLGRELGITRFGLFEQDVLAAPSATIAGPARVVSYESTFFEIPILEYRTYRAFSRNQSSTVLFQLFGGVDVPRNESVENPRGAPPVSLRTVYSLGFRVAFDGRYYP